MKSIQSEKRAASSSGWTASKPINFYCHAPDARAVHFTAELNQWTPVAMLQGQEGWWYLQVKLPHGHHQYRFLIDGRPALDPRATGVGRDEADMAVSVVAVS